MNENNKPRRSIFSIILPYLLMAIAIGAFIAIVVSMNTGNATVWYASTIDTALAENEIKTADVYDKQTVVTVEGIYVSGADNKERRYTFTCSSEQFNYAFDSNGDANNDHAAYRTLFLQEIEQYKVAHIEEASKAYFSDHYAFETNWFEQWGPTLIIGAITILVTFFLFSRLSASVSGSNNKAMDFNRSRARRVDASKVRFSDVAGCDEEKAEMVEVVQYLKEPQKFAKYGAKLPKGILLVGSPGTGKTLLAKAVAGEAGVPFYSISGSDFVEMFVGVGAGRVRDMFKKAKQTAPCLIFIDEIDAVGRQRGAGLGGGNDEREQTLNQLLTEMDGFGANEGIIIIAATNRPDVLDPALLRPGRFDRQVTVSLPDKKAREEILSVHARNKILDKKVTLENLAKRTPGFSGADLENLLNEAALLAVRKNKKNISMTEIDEATDRVLMGPAKVTRKYTDKEKKLVAYHEAGHAVLGLKLDGANEVQKITIIPRGNAGGYTMMLPKEETFNYTKKELLESICGLLGGRVAEEITFNEITTGAHDDFKKATKIARKMVTEYGMSNLGPMMYDEPSENTFLGRDYTKNQNFSDFVAHEIDEEMRSIINSCYDKTKKIITENKDLLKLIAETLLEEETITKEQIEYLVEHGHLEEKEDTENIEEKQNKKATKEK